MDALTTVDKAVDVLFHLRAQDGPRGVTSVSRALGLPKSSAHRLLATLARRGLVDRDERGRYRPGFGLVGLARGVLEREPLVSAARPVLEALAEEVGETCFLVAARKGALVVLEKAEGRGFLRAAPRVGSTLPLHATAVGRLYLAFAPEQVAGPEVLERFTAHTPVTREALERALEATRREGVARNVDQWIPGLSAVAAPVRASGRLEGAVALAAATERVHSLGADRLAARILAAAERTGARLDGRAS